MADLDVGKLSITIEADGRAAIFEIDRVVEAAEGASTEAARAYRDAGRDMAEAFEPAAEAAEKTGETAKQTGEEVRKAGDEIQIAGQKTTKTLKESLDAAEKFGTKMTAGVTAPLVALYTAMSKGASDLTETVSKTDVTFGEFADDMMAWSQTSIEVMGLAQGTALDMAATYGDMATGMGIAKSTAADMSATLTQLAADMASFKNASSDRTYQALTGVFTGETEALKSLGVVMTQANLQAFALTEGITEQVSAMTQAEQVQLRYRYVLAQTANAQGDFARTGGNLANNTRALVQTLKQAGTSFGSVLNPVINEGVTLLREAALSIANLDEGTKTWILSAGGVLASAGPLLLAGSKAVKLVSTLTTAMKALSLGPVALGITAVTAGIVGLHAALSRANEEVDTTAAGYQRFKRIVEGDDKVTIGVDASELDALDDLEGKNYNVTYTVKQGVGSDQEAWDAFHEKVMSMGWEEKHFSATGSFEMDEATVEEIKAYGEALANAATATSEYDAAVESLNALLDEKLQAQLKQINQEVAERTEGLVAMYNEGLISDAEFDAEIEKLVAKARELKEEAEAAAESGKEMNETFMNGSLGDDAGAYGELAKQTYADTTLDTGDMESAIATLENARAAGEDMTQYQNEAKVINQQLAEQAIANYEAMTAAQEEYNAAIQSADATIAGAEANAEQGETLQSMIDAYITAAKMAPDVQTAFDNTNAAYAEQAEKAGATAEEIANIQAMFAELVNGDNGLMTAEETYAEYGAGQVAEGYKAELDAAIEEAEQAKATATENFKTTLQGLSEEFSTTEAQMLMELTASTGASMSAADAEMVAGATTMMESLGTAIETGGEDAVGKVSGIIGAVGDETQNAQDEGQDVGAAITSGITAGLSQGTGPLYAKVRSIVNQAIKEAKKAAESNSPSKKAAREVGAPIIQGIAMGAEEETPNALRTMRASVESLISAGTSVVNHGSYTTPVVQSIAGSSIDYGQMAGAMTDAIKELKLGIRIGERELGTAMRETNARQAALRAHEINIGKGRIS